MFAIDVDGLSPGAPGVIDNSTLGYPLDRLDQISTGDYDVQGLLNIYETFHRADGHTLKLPMDQGEGQQWNLKPGNLYSTVQRIHISGHSDSFSNFFDEGSCAHRTASGHEICQAYSD
jgi:hypothetical protein